MATHFSGVLQLTDLDDFITPSQLRGNEQADRLAGAAPLGGELMYDKADVVRALWDQAGSVKEETEHPHLERLIQRGVSRGSGRVSTLRGKDRRTFNQVSTGTISLGTLRWLLKKGTEHVWECPECSDECIKPVKIDRTAGKVGKIRVEDDGTYMEISQDGKETPLEKAKITLNDCLACSGCITSAESVLISQQSQDELYRILSENSAFLQAGETDKEKLIVVSIAPQARASLAAKFKLSTECAARKLTAFFKRLGVHHVYDTTFTRNFSLIESCHEFVRRFKAAETDKKSLPMLASACPGWICYAEKTHGSYILPYISSTKSPQQIMGSLVKDFLAHRLARTPDSIYHVSVMPCYDKKLEASRTDFFNDVYQTRDVDCVITSGEVEKMLEKEGTSLSDVEEQPLESLIPGTEDHVYNHSGGGSGGYLEHIAKFAASVLLHAEVKDLTYKVLRNQDFQEVTIESQGKPPLRFALAYGFRNIQNIVQRIKRGKCTYHFVEIMACPAGCNNGGGQIRAEGDENQKDRLRSVEEIYKGVPVVNPFQEQQVEETYSLWLGGRESKKAQEMLHTKYHEIEKSTNALNIKW